VSCLAASANGLPAQAAAVVDGNFGGTGNTDLAFYDKRSGTLKIYSFQHSSDTAATLVLRETQSELRHSGPGCPGKLLDVEPRGSLVCRRSAGLFIAFLRSGLALRHRGVLHGRKRRTSRGPGRQLPSAECMERRRSVAGRRNLRRSGMAQRLVFGSRANNGGISLNSPLRKCRFQLGVGVMPMVTTSAAGLASMTAIRPKTSRASVCKTRMKAARASAASRGVP
jgi:hypothetical protein